ncbi:MAG: SRPBCC family protein [Gammaproteobacteria bacterium]
MNLLLKIVGVVVAAILLMILIPTVWGMFLPERHAATVIEEFDAPVDEVWELISEPEARVPWYGYLSRVERLPGAPGQSLRWKEFYVDGQSMVFELTEDEPYRQKIRIAQENLPFGGTWAIDLDPAGTGSRLTITEDGEIYNPFFRFVFRYFVGYDKTIREYMADLSEQLGE